MKILFGILFCEASTSHFVSQTHRVYFPMSFVNGLC